MKRIFTWAIALCLALTCATTAAAQSFSYGIVAGMNLTKLKLKGNYAEALNANLSTENRAGWYFGPKVAFNTVLGIGVDASLQYSLRNLEMSDATGKSQTEKYHTIEIPINVRYNIGLGKKAGVYVSTGPQFGFALNNMSWDNLTSLNGQNFSKENMNTTWNIGAGVRLLDHLEVGIGYNFALGKAGKSLINTAGIPGGTSQDVELEYRTNTFQVQVAYMF